MAKGNPRGFNATKLPFRSLVVDICGRCNLQCRFCPEGRGLNEQPATLMRLPSYQRWIGPVLSELDNLDLFNWSEPLLHPDLFSILQWTAEQNLNLKLRLSTNGVLLDAGAAERLARSPVQALSITFAALTRGEYQQYHGVDAFEKLVISLRTLCSVRKRLNSPNPRIRLRYLRFPFNFATAAQVRRWVKKHLGEYAHLVDRVTIREGYLCGTTLSDEEMKKTYGVDAFDSIPAYPKCRRPFEEPAVRADGAVFPCCALPYRREYVMGFLGEAALEEIWSGPRYREFRESFTRGTNPVCKTCFFRYPRTPLKFDGFLLHRINARWRRKGG